MTAQVSPFVVVVFAWEWCTFCIIENLLKCRIVTTPVQIAHFWVLDLSMWHHVLVQRPGVGSQNACKFICFWYEWLS